MIQVKARLLQGTTVVNEVGLSYAGSTSTFAGRMLLEAVGEFELEILAMDPVKANFARIGRRLTVTSP